MNITEALVLEYELDNDDNEVLEKMIKDNECSVLTKNTDRTIIFDLDNTNTMRLLEIIEKVLVVRRIFELRKYKFLIIYEKKGE